MPAKIHPNAINLICNPFGTHDAGLPEWVKNAREAYMRAGIEDRERRVIIINLLGGSSKNACRGVECIDFVGIDADAIAENLLEWANPEAAAHGLDDASEIEGGQGNGGKAYGRQLFERYRFMSLHDELLSVVGFVDAEKYELGFMQGAQSTDGDSTVIRGGVRKYTKTLLGAVGLSETANITIVRGEGPRHPISAAKVEALLKRSPQAREALRTCDVRLFVKGRQRKRIQLDEPAPHPDFSAPIEVDIPQLLDGPEGEVQTTAGEFGPGVLTLRVARERLRTGQWAGRSTIVFRGVGVRSIGERPTAEFDLSRPQLREHIHGEVRLPLLTDPSDSYELQSRQTLKKGPLSEALYDFIASEITKVLAELDQAAAAKTRVKKKKSLERLHERFENWIETKLAGFDGMSDEGDGEGSGKKKRKKRTEREHEPIASLRSHRNDLALCVGAVDYRLRAVGADASGKPVPTGSVKWTSSDPSVCAVDEATGELTPHSTGSCAVTCTHASGLVGAASTVRVVRAAAIEILNDEPVVVSPNRRIQIKTEVLTDESEVLADAVVGWATDDTSSAVVTQDGVLIGRLPGTTVVRAYASDVESNEVDVEVEKGVHGDADRRTSSRPQILLSGVHPDPLTGDIVELYPSDPPVHQRPGEHDTDTNTWWINLQSPLAEELRKHGPESLQWRTYHFQRIIDVWVRLELYREYRDREDLAPDELVYSYDDLMARIYRDAAEEILALLSDDKVDLSSEG